MGLFICCFHQWMRSMYGMCSLVFSLLLVSIPLFSLTANADNTAVHLRGSTTLLPIAQRIAEEYMAENPKARIAVSGGGTERGYKSIVDGTADIGMASGAEPESILAITEFRGIKLQKNLVGYATILAVANPSNPVDNLSIKQIRDIFTGRITNWKMLGGKNAPIKVYVGPPTGGINATWKSLIFGEGDSYTPTGTVLENAERIHAVERDPNAISFLTLDYSNYSKLKILKVDDVAPDEAEVRSGHYLLRAPLMLVTKGKPSATAQKFIDYFLAPERNIPVEEMVDIALMVEVKGHE